MRIRCAVLLLLLVPTCLAARISPRPGGKLNFDWQNEIRPGVRYAYNWQPQGSFEFGLLVILRGDPRYSEAAQFMRSEEAKSRFTPKGWWDAGIGVDMPRGESHLIFGPKLFTEFNLGFFSTAINATYYLYGNVTDIRITPEIGLAYHGYVGVRYAYNWAPAGRKFENIDTNRITVFVVLAKPRTLIQQD